MKIMFLCEVRAFIQNFRINRFKPERMQRPDMKRSVFVCFLYVIRCEFNIMNNRFQFILPQNIKIQNHEIVACCQNEFLLLQRFRSQKLRIHFHDNDTKYVINCQMMAILCSVIREITIIMTKILILSQKCQTI